MSDDAQELVAVPLFPLNTVLFPGVTIPLHIFEDRYRALVHHLLRLDPEDRMFGSVAIRGDLVGCYVPTPLQPSPDDPAFPAYQQFLHMGEAGLATLMMVPLVSGFMAPEAERDNWGARWARGCVERRLLLVRSQLARAPYMGGDRFTAADISVSFALRLGANHAGFALADAEQAYLARTTGREAYKRAFDRSHEGLSA